MPSELVPTSAPFVPQKAPPHPPVKNGRNEPRMKSHASSKPLKHHSSGQGSGRNHKGSGNNSGGDKSGRGGKGGRGHSGKGGKGSAAAASSLDSSAVPPAPVSAAISPLDQEAAEEAEALAAVEAFLAAEAAHSEAGGSNSKSGSSGGGGGRRQKGKGLDHLLGFQFAKPEAAELFAPPSNASSSSVRSSSMSGASSSGSSNRWWNSNSSSSGGGGRSRQSTGASSSSSRGGRLHLVLCPNALSARINHVSTATLPPGASGNGNSTISSGAMSSETTKKNAPAEEELQVPAYVETAQRWGVSNKPAWMNRPEFQSTTTTTTAAAAGGEKSRTGGRTGGRTGEKDSSSGKSNSSSSGSAHSISSSKLTTTWSSRDIMLDPDDDAIEWSEVVAMAVKVDSLSEAVCPVERGYVWSACICDVWRGEGCMSACACGCAGSVWNCKLLCAVHVNCCHGTCHRCCVLFGATWFRCCDLD